MNICVLSAALPVHCAGAVGASLGPGLSDGEAPAHAAALAAELVRQKHSVTVLTTGLHDGPAAREENGHQVRYLACAPGVYSAAWWKRSAQSFREQHARRPFQAVFGEDIAAAAVTGLSDRPPVFPVVYGPCLRRIRDRPCEAARLLYFAATYERLLLRRAAAVVATADWMRAAYERPARRVVVAYNGVDTERFKPVPDERAAARAKLGIPADAFVAALADPSDDPKASEVGLAMLLSLMAAHPRLMVLVGGALEGALRAAAESPAHGPRVRIVGGLAPDRLPGFYNAADVLLYPSVRAGGVPPAVAAAMACGVPAVAAGPGAASAVSHGKNGFLAPPARRDLLKAGVHEALLSPGLLKEWSQEARRTAVRKLHFPDIVRRIMKELF